MPTKDSQNEFTPLEFATVTQLIDELAKRTRGAIVAIAMDRKDGNDPDIGVGLYMCGPRVIQAGLLDSLTRRVRYLSDLEEGLYVVDYEDDAELDETDDGEADEDDTEAAA